MNGVRRALATWCVRTFRSKRAIHTDKAANYGDAFRRWHLSARQDLDPSSKAGAIMRAARARQMAEDWRAEAGHWEWLGNTLGRAIDQKTVSVEVLENRYGTPRGRGDFAAFYVMSDVEWDQPVADQRYGSDDALARHRQAAAYQWAAERAATAGQHDEAARLYRRAGISWEWSEHPERHQRAASCYYRTAMSAGQSLRHQTRRRVFDGWCPSCLRDKAREESCGSPKHGEPRDPNFSTLGDLDRLLACWKHVLKEDGGAARGSHFQEAQRQLSVIQHTLAAAGARTEALRTYRIRMHFRRQHLRRTWSWRWPFVAAHWLLSCYSSRVKQVLSVLVIFYALICPIMWRQSGAIRLPRLNGAAELTHSWGEALAFSMSNMLNLSNGHFEAGGTLVTLLQAVQGISAYFALGYTLWVAQRSYSS